MAGASGRFERVRDPMEVHVRSLVDLAMFCLFNWMDDYGEHS